VAVAAVDDELVERGQLAPATVERTHMVNLEWHAGCAAALASVTGAVERLPAELLPAPAADTTVLPAETLVGRGMRTTVNATNSQGARHLSESALPRGGCSSYDGRGPRAPLSSQALIQSMWIRTKLAGPAAPLAAS
jgi:hypothetical protein